MQNESSNIDHEIHPVVNESCQGCRKRKLKCSRDVPICLHCQRLGALCVYDGKKNKPGLKTGAVESLNRRIEVLEDIVLRNASGAYDPGPTGAQDTTPSQIVPSEIVSTLASLCAELCNMNSRAALANASSASPIPPNLLPPPSPSTLSSSSYNQESRDRARKRRRVDSCGNPNIRLEHPLEDITDSFAALPPPQLVEHVVDAYFTTFQPWIPIIHETHFRRRLQDRQKATRLVIILHAMIVAAMRFVDPNVLIMPRNEIEAWVRRSRNVVVVEGMELLSLESLQALIIIAFNDIGNGDEAKACVENDQTEEQPVFKPRVSLAPAAGWVEEEERRRVFWNIFNLDRFCSVLTGWNTSLTAEDVHRRLPADGGYWHNSEPVVTPFFGIWTRFEAKMGNSVAFLPAHYTSPGQNMEAVAHGESPISNPHTARASIQVDMSTVGAFAYCIEATESLSQVTSYFLQQKVNFSDRRQVSIWLTRFKELDLRLVHWKMFLPEKWKDSNISRQPTIVNMDPNLTLAHLSHNTSMILLHQRIAYPQSEWKNLVKLPSACSAETCQNAAIETQNIADKYLRHSNGPVNNQFTFCVFVAAIVLLDEMAKRWVQRSASEADRRSSLAGSFAEHLRELHQRCTVEPELHIDLLSYSSGFNRKACSVSSGNNDDQTSMTHHYQTASTSLPNHMPNMQREGNSQPWHGNVYTPREDTVQQNEDATHDMGFFSHGLAHGAVGDSGESQMSLPQAPKGNMLSDELSNISYMLLDRSFMDLDRIITLENMTFSAPMASSTNMGMTVDESIMGNGI
ncbi:hypothetical protein TruAng_004207 [Truncatella angustata]|nr:hypothetical protein TruAng_004207 [Truncatella angustata]